MTIPADLRHKHGLHEGDELDVVEDGDQLSIIRRAHSTSRGTRLVQRMRGRATTEQTTDELMRLLRDD